MGRRPSRVATSVLPWALAGVTAALALVIAVQVFRSTVEDGTNREVPSLALVALVVLLTAFTAPLLLRRLDLGVSVALPWVAGVLSAVLAVILAMLWSPPLVTTAWTEVVSRGLHVPFGLDQFWDLSLVLKSVDCAAFGFDVYEANNGCLRDPSIYGPGTLWLQYAPFDLFSARNATALGFTAVAISSLALVWIARLATARGQIVLLIAAVSGSWLLLLERSNFDAFVIWAAVALAFLVRRWNSLWAWTLGAALLWLVGTWKYYPFALGLMLVPVLMLRRGWLVLVGFAAASLAFVTLTWDNLVFSMQANEGMPVNIDLVILGRFPVVTRMLGADTDPATLQLADALFVVLALAGLGWGIAFARALRGVRRTESMLAIGGSTLFLTSVLVSGFGYAYKAAFLALIVPLLAMPRNPRDRFVLYSSLVMLALVAITTVVVWNTVLATVAGITVAGFGLGASATLLVRGLRGRRRSRGETGATNVGR